MRWPWRKDPGEGRRAPSGEPSTPTPMPGADPPAPGPRPSGADWASLPPIRRTFPEIGLISQPRAFPDQLPVWARPTFIGPMVHLVDPKAPAGLVDGDGGHLGSPTVDSGGPELVLPPPPAPRARPRRAVQRLAPGTPARPVGALLSGPDPRPGPRPVQAVPAAPEQAPGAEVEPAETEPGPAAETATILKVPTLADPASGTPAPSTSGPSGRGGEPAPGNRGGEPTPGDSGSGVDRAHPSPPLPVPVAARLHEDVPVQTKGAGPAGVSSEPTSPGADETAEPTSPGADEPTAADLPTERPILSGDHGQASDGPGNVTGAADTTGDEHADGARAEEAPVRRLGLGAPLAGLPDRFHGAPGVQRGSGVGSTARDLGSIGLVPGGEAFSDGDATYVPLASGDSPGAGRSARLGAPTSDRAGSPAPPDPPLQRSIDGPAPAPAPPPDRPDAYGRALVATPPDEEPATRAAPMVGADIRVTDGEIVGPPAPGDQHPVEPEALPAVGADGWTDVSRDAAPAPTSPILSAAWAASPAPLGRPLMSAAVRPSARTGAAHAAADVVVLRRVADARAPSAHSHASAAAAAAAPTPGATARSLQRTPASRLPPLTLPPSGHPTPAVGDAPTAAAIPRFEVPAAVQRDAEAPAPTPTEASPGPSEVGAAGTPGTDQVDELVRRLAGPMIQRVRAELLLERERRGIRTDIG